MTSATIKTLLASTVIATASAGFAMAQDADIDMKTKLYTPKTDVMSATEYRDDYDSDVEDELEEAGDDLEDAGDRMEYEAEEKWDDVEDAADRAAYETREELDDMEDAVDDVDVDVDADLDADIDDEPDFDDLD